MQIAIIQFPGSNCERETMLAVKRAGMNPVEFLWNQPTEQLQSFDGYIIVGGFSYEDRSRAGIIAALDPVMTALKAQSKLGKPILGICNGAQILVETGLVPGIENDKLTLVLTDNKRIQHGKVLGTGFYNAWIDMRLSDNYQLNAFTRHLTPKDILHVPVAHAEGRFVLPPALLTEVIENGLNVFQYCNAEGQIIDEFPINPNGSMNNIAAISNKAGNVMAMMPHPERTSAGDKIFSSMKEYIAKNLFQTVQPLHYYPRLPSIKKFIPKHPQLLIELIITDNQALSVENALQQHLKLPIKIKRFIHWEIECESEEIIEQIKLSGVLFNDRKESLLKNFSSNAQNTFLVRAKEDIIGQQKKQLLEDHFAIQGITTIHHGIVWQITSDQAESEVIDSIINAHILFNPYAHECYRY